MDGKSDADALADLKKAQLPLTPLVNLLAKSVEDRVHVRLPPRRSAGDELRRRRRAERSAEIWSSLKSPIWAQEQIAEILGLPVGSVTVHVIQGGGSFGRHLFSDAAFEAAAVSRRSASR